MKRIDIIGEAQGISHYPANVVTCYPGSNQRDDGKLQLEFNMARLVTRVTSKNFCIVKPSFELSIVQDSDTGVKQIRIQPGQASINGMDLIITSTIDVNPPKEIGKFHLVFQLARDSSDNVLGDLIYGATETFEGVYIAYFDEKDETDPYHKDRLFLGSFDWDGENFNNLVEDEDKYGRIWAEDVLGRFLDPKHPDVRRLNLQELIYNLPDWYFSKEGDIVYGPITIADNRDKNNPGIIMNVDGEGSHITIKDPQVDNNLLQRYGDLNRDGVVDDKDLELVQKYVNGEATLTDLQKQLADVNHDGQIDENDLKYINNYITYQNYLASLPEGAEPKTSIEMDLNFGDTTNIYYIDNSDKGINFDVGEGKSGFELGKASIYESESDNELHIHNDGAICIDAEGEVKIEGDERITISTENPLSPKVTLDDKNVSITDPDAPELKFNFTFEDVNIAKYTLGKAIWQYNNGTKKVSLLSDDVSYLDVQPNADFNKSARVRDTIYIGSESIYGNEKTFLKKLQWRLTDASNKDYIDFTPSTINMVNPDGDGTSYISARSGDSQKYSRIFDNGTIELQNDTINPAITFKDGTATNTVTVEKIKGEKKLNIDGILNVTNNIIGQKTIDAKEGLITSNGYIYFKRGTNDAQLYKENNGNILVTSGPFKVGASGTQPLYAGNTVINGTFAVGGNSYANSELQIDASGNLVTTGEITGSRVHNAVYNDYAEYFEKQIDEIIEPGDLVCIREDGLAYKVETVRDLDAIIGVCSDTAGVLLGGQGLEDNQKVLVGMVGKLYTKTNNNYIRPGQMVKALPDGTVDFASDKKEKFGLAMSTVENGKVRIVFNG